MVIAGAPVHSRDGQTEYANRTRLRGQAHTLMAIAAALALAGGCGIKTTELRIVDYRDPGGAAVYTETFDEAYYHMDETGNVDVVLRREQPGLDGREQTITQIIHLRSVWRSIPGRTVAATTQINGTVSYLITNGQVGAAFGGAGSIFYREDRTHTVLTGKLERAYLTPQNHVASDPRVGRVAPDPRVGRSRQPLFTRAVLSGQFRAIRDPRRVRRILNETELLLGPITRLPPT